MKGFIIKGLFLIIISTKLFSQSLLKDEYQDIIRPFLEAVQNNDKEKIMDLVQYPLKRHYPIPSVNNKIEMNERFDIIFDKILLDLIQKSSIENDWSDIGWRGIMLGNGIIWIDYNGKLITINYQSQNEIEIMNNIISEIKNNIHESLSEFLRPILLCETDNYKIQIDLLNEDNNIYRFRLALWSSEKNQLDTPDLILLDGECIFEGNGGNHHFVFNDVYQYIVSIDILTATEYGYFSIYDNKNNTWLDNLEDYRPLFKEKINEIES